MDQWGVPVVVGNVEPQEVDVDGMFPPHPVEQHHHLDAVVYGDGDVGVLHDGDPHAETEAELTSCPVRSGQSDGTHTAGGQRSGEGGTRAA